MTRVVPALLLAVQCLVATCASAPAALGQEDPAPHEAASVDEALGAAPAGLMPSEADLRVTPIVRAVRRAADSVVSIYLVDSRAEAEGQGSGVVLDAAGLVITNWHVVAAAVAMPGGLVVQVRLRDKRQFKARLLSSSPEYDLALLQLQMPKSERVQPITLGDSSTLMIGETVIAIGNPQGHANTVTVGVLSAQDRSIQVGTPDGFVRRYSGLLQTDAAINQGNSGGALLDITGKLIGINNAMAAHAENIGFAIPVDAMRRVFRDVLLSAENLANVWLGMRVTDQDGTVVVAEVEPEGPADRAGIVKGDQILAASGESLDSSIGYARRLLDARAGQPFELQVERDHKKVRLSPVPLSSMDYELVHRLGLEVETVVVRNANRRNQRQTLQRVTRVYPGGPAERGGLEPGDILLAGVDYSPWAGPRDVAIRSPEHLLQFARSFAGERMKLILQRNEEQHEATLQPRV